MKRISLKTNKISEALKNCSEMMDKNHSLLKSYLIKGKKLDQNFKSNVKFVSE